MRLNLIASIVFFTTSILYGQVYDTATVNFTTTVVAPQFVGGGAGVTGVVASGIDDNTVDSDTIIDGSIINIDINGNAGISYSKLNLTGSIVNADVSGTASIAYSKLNLSNSILNNDVGSGAGIVYSKLNLSNSVMNSDVSANASIAFSKLNIVKDDIVGLGIPAQDTTYTAGTSLTLSEGAFSVTALGITDAQLATDSVTSAKILNGAIINEDINASASIAYSKLSLSNSILNADINTGAGIVYSKLSLANSITNGDLAGSIASSKLVGTDIATVGTITAGTWNANVIGDSYINDALTISGGVINNTTIGLTTPTASAFSLVRVKNSGDNSILGTIAVGGTSSGFVMEGGNNDGEINIYNHFGDFEKAQKLLRYRSQAWRFYTNDTERFTIKEAGIGLFNSSPTHALDVSGDAKISVISNATGNFVTLSDQNVLTKRTALEVLDDIGAQPLLTNPLTGTGNENEFAKFNVDGSVSGTPFAVLTRNFHSIETNNKLHFRANLGYIGVRSSPDYPGWGSPNQFTGGVGLIEYTTASGSGALLRISKSGGDGFTTFGALANDSLIGSIQFIGDKGDSLQQGAYIQSRTEGVPTASTNGLGADIRLATSIVGGAVTERMRIRGTGLIGIGTTDPQELLHVAGNIHMSGADRTVFNRSNNSLTFGTNNTARAIILASGEVGIGTTTPTSSAILELVSTSRLFIPPKMTTAQRNAIVGKSAGGLAYDTDLNKLVFWNGTAFEVVTSVEE
jgi:hypothetical protein